MRIVFALILALLLSSCSREPVEHKYKLYVFGTLVEFILYDVEKDKADTVIAELSERFQHMHRDWHAWKPGELTALNQAIRDGKPMTVSNSLIAELQKARQFEQKSDGLFNPAIGALISLWGFHADDKPTGPPPDKERIKQLVDAHPRLEDLTISGNTVSSRNRWVQFDFGGFAKGSALDWAAQTLKKNGINNAVLNAGGDLNVIGRHGARPWKIGIRHPKHWGIVASVDLGPDEVLYTSGNYHRFLEHEGLRYSHILDPRTGWPVDHIVSSSVIHSNGALADAAATALSVAGPKDWLRIARRMQLDEILLVDNKGGLYMTPKMQKRLKIEAKDVRVIEVKDPLISSTN
jgi:thiamine biosynthesis lipoprotein